MTDQDRRLVAAKANVDVRTVERALTADGSKRVRSASTRAAIVAALRELGFKRQASNLERGGT
jgi:DNA-binding LacI/PurR family transcriptional regulator